MAEMIPMWKPENITDTRMYKFMKHVESISGIKLETYHDLYSWSINNISHFWDIFLKFSKIIYDGKNYKVLDESLAIVDVPTWFDGVTLNFTENLLKNKSDRLAIISISESGVEKKLSFRELYEQVSILHHAFKRFGLKQGDIAAAILPNDHIPVIAMLAVASLGCIWTSFPCESQARGIFDKLESLVPKIIISVDSLVYGGNQYDQISKLKEFEKHFESKTKIVVYGQIKDCDFSPTITTIDQFLLEFGQEGDGKTIDFVRTKFNHPLFIMYTSGTTGPPKKLLHSAGGTLIQIVKEHLLHGNSKEEDRMLFYTSTAWMMWNWAVTFLFCEASLVLYSGSPLRPNVNILWDLIEKYEVSILGAGSAYFSHLDKSGAIPNKKHKFKTLRSILSTGSYLPPSLYHFIDENVKKGIHIGSILGGTDLISCFCGHNPMVPVYHGQIQAPNLAMSIKCYDDSGMEILDEYGDLVCIKPFPSMPVAIVLDNNNEKYKSTYFSKYPGVWWHGDFCKFDSKTRGIIVRGRSDATLKVNGVRFGSGEIYIILSEIPAILDSLVIGQDIDDGNQRLVLFLKYDESLSNFDDLRKATLAKIRNSLGSRYLPSLILPAPDIPYTLTGKKVEVLIKKIISQQPVKPNREILRNPESLDYFLNLKS